MDPITHPLHLTVRPAKPSDRALIARLCRRAVSRSDYVLRILPTLIARGGLFLAWNGDVLVGITNFDECIDGSGWLSVARTDSDWRGRGVATFLQREIAGYARRRGVGILRMWVSSDNKPSLRACARGGFKEICEAAHIHKALRASKSSRRQMKPTRPSESDLSDLLKSTFIAKTQGYIGYSRHFVKLTKRLLTNLRKRGELYQIGRGILVITPPDTLFRIPQSSLTILQGPFGESLKMAATIARNLGARRLGSYIPYSRYELSTAKRLGFSRTPWGTHCLVFEKRIGNPPRPYGTEP